MQIPGGDEAADVGGEEADGVVTGDGCWMLDTGFNAPNQLGRGGDH